MRLIDADALELAEELDDKLFEAEQAHGNPARWFEEQKIQFARAEALEAHVRDLERERDALLEANNQSVCIFCGEMMAKGIPTMLEHAKGCKERPENRLHRELDAAIGRLADLGVCTAKEAVGCEANCLECWADAIRGRADA